MTFKTNTVESSTSNFSPRASIYSQAPPPYEAGHVNGDIVSSSHSLPQEYKQAFPHDRTYQDPRISHGQSLSQDYKQAFPHDISDQVDDAPLKQSLIHEHNQAFPPIASPHPATRRSTGPPRLTFLARPTSPGQSLPEVYDPAFPPSSSPYPNFRRSPSPSSPPRRLARSNTIVPPAPSEPPTSSQKAKAPGKRNSIFASLAAKARGHGIDLYNAAAYGSPQELSSLLDRGADPNFRVSGYGSTPLHQAAAHGRVENLQILLDGGANVAAKDRFARTALHEAVFYGHEDVVRALAKSGADCYSKDDIRGWTPVHEAAFHGCERILWDLLRGASEVVDARDFEQQTALHLAVRNRSYACVELLIEAGAGLRATDQRECTPLMKAVAMGDGRLVEMLEKEAAARNRRAAFVVHDTPPMVPDKF